MRRVAERHSSSAGPGTIEVGRGCPPVYITGRCRSERYEPKETGRTPQPEGESSEQKRDPIKDPPPRHPPDKDPPTREPPRREPDEQPVPQKVDLP